MHGLRIHAPQMVSSLPGGRALAAPLRQSVDVAGVRDLEFGPNIRLQRVGELRDPVVVLTGPDGRGEVLIAGVPESFEASDVFDLLLSTELKLADDRVEDPYGDASMEIDASFRGG